MCPAVIFAANRNDRVSGRTNTLVVSINTRNGFSQSGAPSGRKCAVDCLGACMNLEIIILIHSGKPIVRVIIKCLESLKVYGNIPIRLIAISVKNSGAIIEDKPFRDFAPVRISWEYMTSNGCVINTDHRPSVVYVLFIRTVNKVTLMRRNIVVQRTKKFADAGSNVEKISGIMQDSGLVPI
jgi:hypothetical protein